MNYRQVIERMRRPVARALRMATMSELHRERPAVAGDTDTGAEAAESRGMTLLQEARASRSARLAWCASIAPLCAEPWTRAALTVEAIAARAMSTARVRLMVRSIAASMMRATAGAHVWNGPQEAAVRPQEARTARVRLTMDARSLIRTVRDAVAREAVGYEAMSRLMLWRPDAEAVAARMNRAATAGYDAEPWRGLVAAREARAAERGRGMLRTASAAAVSVRDAHLPAGLLRHAATVGYATHPHLSAAQRDGLMAAVIAEPQRATVLTLRPGPHGLMRSVRPAAEYIALRQERTEAVRSISAAEARHVRNVMAHARIGLANPMAANE